MTAASQAGKVVIRQAVAAEIGRLIEIRGAVRENRLSDPTSVTRSDYDWFVTRGLVWIAIARDRVAGFSAADPRDATIWALFVDPACEGEGFGAMLLERALFDLTAAGHGEARLFTDPGTKAARLYRKLGWREQGLTADAEMEFRLNL
ncbi:MAG: GNAT family N-acetyltransferase [Tabrizicola sp.]|nr:GNAT family N-acetyltransferase [Tabrizicola sp.]